LCVICGDGYVLGGSLNGKWLDNDEAAKELSGDERFSFLSLGGAEIGKYVCSKPTYDSRIKGIKIEDDPCPIWRVKFNPPLSGVVPKTNTGMDAYFDSFYIAVHCPWNPFPRNVRIDPTPNDLDIKAAQQELKHLQEKLADTFPNRFSDPQVVIEQIIRGDLDGDGVEETLITASPVKGETSDGNGKIRAGEMDLPKHPPQNSYSFVLLRKNVNGQEMVHTIVEDSKSDLENKFWKHRVSLVADLNGDGSMEFLTQGAVYTGGFYQLWTIKKDRPKEIFGYSKKPID
jgi:hypothetical protein